MAWDCFQPTKAELSSWQRARRPAQPKHFRSISLQQKYAHSYAKWWAFCRYCPLASDKENTWVPFPSRQASPLKRPGEQRRLTLARPLGKGESYPFYYILLQHLLGNKTTLSDWPAFPFAVSPTNSLKSNSTISSTDYSYGEPHRSFLLRFRSGLLIVQWYPVNFWTTTPLRPARSSSCSLLFTELPRLERPLPLSKVFCLTAFRL